MKELSFYEQLYEVNTLINAKGIKKAAEEYGRFPDKVLQIGLQLTASGMDWPDLDDFMNRSFLMRDVSPSSPNWTRK